jgi:hypothetical protein
VHAVWSPVRDYIGTRVIGVLSCFARAGVAGRRFVGGPRSPTRLDRMRGVPLPLPEVLRARGRGASAVGWGVVLESHPPNSNQGVPPPAPGTSRRAVSREPPLPGYIRARG